MDGRSNTHETLSSPFNQQDKRQPKVPVREAVELKLQHDKRGPSSRSEQQQQHDANGEEAEGAAAAVLPLNGKRLGIQDDAASSSDDDDNDDDDEEEEEGQQITREYTGVL